MNKKCDFCSHDRAWIFENKYFYSMFDLHPVSPGHALVIAKRHVASIMDLQTSEWAALKEALTKTTQVINKANKLKLYQDFIKQEFTAKSPWFCRKMLVHLGINKKAKSFTIGVNDGPEAGRTIDHMHIQIIPRYAGDVKNPTGGIRNIIPHLGNYKK